MSLPAARVCDAPRQRVRARPLVALQIAISHVVGPPSSRPSPASVAGAVIIGVLWLAFPPRRPWSFLTHGTRRPASQMVPLSGMGKLRPRPQPLGLMRSQSPFGSRCPESLPLGPAVRARPPPRVREVPDRTRPRCLDRRANVKKSSDTNCWPRGARALRLALRRKDSRGELAMSSKLALRGHYCSSGVDMASRVRWARHVSRRRREARIIGMEPVRTAGTGATCSTEHAVWHGGCFS